MKNISELYQIRNDFLSDIRTQKAKMAYLFTNAFLHRLNEHEFEPEVYKYLFELLVEMRGIPEHSVMQSENYSDFLKNAFLETDMKVHKKTVKINYSKFFEKAAPEELPKNYTWGGKNKK